MRNETTEKVLKLILRLLDTSDHGVEWICEQVGVSRRTLYYLLEFLRSNGFIVFKQRGCYHLDRRSPFISEVVKSVQFSDNELLTIWNLLGTVGMGNETVNTLRRKLDAAYDFSTVISTPEARKKANIVKKLEGAIARKRMVRLLDYSSPHSHTLRDRLVEPFLLMNNNRDVRCYEISSGINKTFKLARMSDVEVLDDSWIHEKEHKQMFTDVFMFSGESHHNVRLRLGQLSRNLFIEEYPMGVRNVQPDPAYPDHWILDIEVCDYRGIGRFVLGLYEDIEILDDDNFREYIQMEIQRMYETAVAGK